VRKTCYISAPSLRTRQTCIHITGLEDVSAADAVVGMQEHPEMLLVNQLHPTGVDHTCDALVAQHGFDQPLRALLAAEGGEDAFGRYAEVACMALVAAVRSDAKARGASVEVRPGSARVRPGSATQSVLRMAQRGARSLHATLSPRMRPGMRPSPRILPPATRQPAAPVSLGGPYPPLSPRLTASPQLLQSPRGGQYVAIFGSRIFLNAIAHAIGCAAGAPLAVLDAMLDIQLEEAEAILVPLFGGVHATAIQHLKRPR